MKKKTMLDDFIVRDHFIYVLFNSCLEKYSLDNGQLIKVLSFDKKNSDMFPVSYLHMFTSNFPMLLLRMPGRWIQR